MLSNDLNFADFSDTPIFIIEFNPVTLEIVWQYSQPKPTADYSESQFRLLFV